MKLLAACNMCGGCNTVAVRGHSACGGFDKADKEEKLTIKMDTECQRCGEVDFFHITIANIYMPPTATSYIELIGDFVVA